MHCYLEGQSVWKLIDEPFTPLRQSMKKSVVQYLCKTHFLGLQIILKHNIRVYAISISIVYY